MGVKISQLHGTYQKRTIKQLGKKSTCTAEWVFVDFDKLLAFIKQYDNLVGVDL